MKDNVLSIKQNILSTYVSQIYVTLIGIVMVPFYIRYMGTEAYGLVGFFAMLQAWFQLLDMGLTPTMAREAARFNGGAIDARSLRQLLRVLEAIFIAVAVVGAGVMLLGADYIAGSWLKLQQLPLVEVRNAVMLMALIVAMRWISGLYRGVITGFERLVWLGGINALFATVRFVLVIPFFIWVGSSPTEFFFYQLIVAIAELAVLVIKSYQVLPGASASKLSVSDWSSLRAVLRFSLSLAFISAVWVLVTQTDKLILSKLLSLTDYAYYSLAVLVAGAVMIVSGPISAALIPRLTRLSAEGNEDGLIELYRNATQMVAVIAIPVALMLALFAKAVLWAWTGDAVIAQSAAPILSLYVLGNATLVVGAFPYYLQYAKGDLKLHLIGNVLFVIFLVPGVVWATLNYGVIGAGYAWLLVNVLYFMFWVPLVHARFQSGLHWNWLLYDVGSILVPALVVGAGVYYLVPLPQQRYLQLLVIMALGMPVLLAAGFGSSLARGWGGRWLMVKFSKRTSV